MNKIAQFVDYYRNLGRQDAMAASQKTAGMLPSSRLVKAALGALGIAGGIGAAKALSRPEPSTLENLYEGGKDMLSNMSQEDLMGYARLLQNAQGGGGYSSMGYSAASPSPSDYAMQDLGSMDYGEDPYAQMGYEAQMSPEEMQQYMAYYS